MSSVAGSSPDNIGSAIRRLGGMWGWIVALGVFYVIGGVVALGSVLMATVVTVTLVGLMMLLAGVIEFICAFQMKSWGQFFVWMFMGALYAIAGVFTLMDPLLVAGILTLLIGAALLATGIVRIFIGFQMRAGPWGWVVVSGVVTTLLGVVILVHWPVSSLYVLGTFLGVDLLLAGMGWINIGLAVRKQA